MAEYVFQRYEKKYLLRCNDYMRLRQLLKVYMQEDQYGWHTIRNIYYDTSDSQLIRNSIARPVYKEKFRVRCYGEPMEDSMVFLEIKKKYEGLVNKRRIAIPFYMAKDFMDNQNLLSHRINLPYEFQNRSQNHGEENRRGTSQGDTPGNRQQILSEISYFLHYYSVYPRVYLAYDRIALVGKDDANFRITFDKNIRSRFENLVLESDEGTTMLMREGYYLMEVKMQNAMPLWFATLLSEMELYSVSFSKYGNVYCRHMMEERTKERKKSDTTEEIRQTGIKKEVQVC